jgi:hypothetical protein
LGLFNDDAMADFAMEMDGAKRSAVEEGGGKPSSGTIADPQLIANTVFGGS